MLLPVLPFINDTEENILGVVRLAAQAGAKWVYAYSGFGVTLRQNQRLWFFDRLDEEFPGMTARYIERFGDSYQCSSPDSDRLMPIFRAECARLGLLCEMRDINAAIRAGSPPQGEQLSLF